MSELVLARSQNIRWQLLAGVSALALVASMTAVVPAQADEDNHFYIELGTSYGAQAGGSTAWFLPFAAPGAPSGGEGGEGGDGGGAGGACVGARQRLRVRRQQRMGVAGGRRATGGGDVMRVHTHSWGRCVPSRGPTSTDRRTSQ